MILFPLLLIACQNDLETYSGDFDGLREIVQKKHLKRIRKWDIVLDGYLSRYDELPHDIDTPVLLYENRTALENAIVWERKRNESFLVTLGGRDASRCFGKYVRLTGNILEHDRGRIFLEASKLNQIPDPSVGSLDSEISEPVSCFQ